MGEWVRYEDIFSIIKTIHKGVCNRCIPVVATATKGIMSRYFHCTDGDLIAMLMETIYKYDSASAEKRWARDRTEKFKDITEMKAEILRRMGENND